MQTLLAAYNDEWKHYTSESTLNTAKFIDERLTVIEKELSSVDENIAKFKSDNQLLDINAETMQVTSESSKYSDLTFQTSNQLAVARFIREYLTDKTKEYDLLPSNSGIESQSIESQIAEYNKLLLDRQRLAAGSSDNNPLVADLNEQLKMLHSAIQNRSTTTLAALKYNWHGSPTKKCRLPTAFRPALKRQRTSFPSNVSSKSKASCISICSRNGKKTNCKQASPSTTPVL